MKKIHVLGLALLAVFAFSAVAAASALAGTPEWLANGAAINGSLEAETTGTVNLVHLEKTIFSPEVVIECTGVFDGTVEGGANGFGTVTELLSGGVQVTLTKQLRCKSVKNCEEPMGEETPTAVAENLPWLTSNELMPGATHEWLILFSEEPVAKKGLPAYEIKCKVLGTTHEVLCEGETSAYFELMVAPEPHLLGVFNETELAAEGLEGTCFEGPTEQKTVAVQNGSGSIVLKNGQMLDVSEGTEEP